MIYHTLTHSPAIKIFFRFTTFPFASRPFFALIWWCSAEKISELMMMTRRELVVVEPATKFSPQKTDLGLSIYLYTLTDCFVDNKVQCKPLCILGIPFWKLDIIVFCFCENEAYFKKPTQPYRQRQLSALFISTQQNASCSPFPLFNLAQPNTTL